MQNGSYFTVQEIQIGNMPALPGNQWVETLDKFVHGVETENHDVLQRPLLTMRGNQDETLILRFEPEISGFYGLGTGGKTPQLPMLTEGQYFDTGGFGIGPTLSGLKGLLSRHHSATLLSFTPKEHMALVTMETLLLVGHEGLLPSLVNYGVRIGELRRQSVSPVKA